MDNDLLNKYAWFEVIFMTVIVYSTPTCAWCKKLKEFLDENNIEYIDMDVSSNPDAAQEMILKSGQIGVPVVDVDGNIVVGFDKDKLKKLLGI